jgi:hypothetical protein
VKDRRWDIDKRGHGVADASALASGVRELADMLAVADWVAEQPEAHLLPHIERACEATGLELVGHEIVDAILTIRIALPAELGQGEARAAAYRVIGSFAEAATSIRQRGMAFEVVTGMLDPDTLFAPHGHMVRLEFVPPE